VQAKTSIALICGRKGFLCPANTVMPFMEADMNHALLTAGVAMLARGNEQIRKLELGHSPPLAAPAPRDELTNAGPNRSLSEFKTLD